MSPLATAPWVLVALLAGQGSDGRRGGNVDDDLKTALDHRRPALDRARAIDRLGRSGAEVAIPALILELQRTDGALQDALRVALAHLDATRVLARELAAADPKVRVRAAELLPFVPGPDGVEPLLAATHDPVPKVRELAAAALWRFADPRAIGPLTAALATDADPDVRSAAAQSLGRIGGPEARRALDLALDREPDAFVRILIEEALKR